MFFCAKSSGLIAIVIIIVIIIHVIHTLNNHFMTIIWVNYVS